jgi:RNA polymerase sigma-70 factor (ECF subfamily)
MIACNLDISARFQTVFRDHYRFVLGVLRRRGVSEAEVEDVAHDVFLVFLRRIDDYDRTRPARPWLRAIAYRVASDHRRLARHRWESAVGDELERVSGASVDSAAWVAARQVVEALDSSRTEVLLLHDVMGYSMREISGRLGIPLNTGYTRLRLARASMKAAA